MKLSSWPLKRAFVLYDGGAMGSTLRGQVLACNPVMSDSGNDSDINYFKQNAPSFTYLRYKSISDNYVKQHGSETPGTHDWLAANCWKYGLTIEDFYYHYQYDTNQTLYNNGVAVQTLCKGYPFGTAANVAESRVPTYYTDLSRCLLNFQNPQVRLCWLEYFTNQILNVKTSLGDYCDGVWLDNGGKNLLNTGLSASQPDPVNSGVLKEMTAGTKLGSQSFYDQFYYNSFGLFTKQLRQYADSCPTILGGRKYYVALNIATTVLTDTQEWLDAYVTFNPAHILFLEFLHQPGYFAGQDFGFNSFLNEEKASNAGITVWETGFQYGINAASSGNGVYTSAELILSTLANHWLRRSERSVITGYPHSWLPLSTDWQFYNLKQCWKIDLGRGINSPDRPYVIATGRDPIGAPNGQPYKVYAREFYNGLAVVRNLGANGESQYAGSAVTINLPSGNWKQIIDMDGTLGSQVTTASIRNGQGLLFQRV